MAAIITNKFRIHNAEQFEESFSESSSNTYYMLLGRPQAFATSTRPDGRTENEGTVASPLTPVDSVQSEFYAFDDALATKKVTSSDISFVIPRRNWTPGTVYDYTDTITVTELQELLLFKQLIVVLLICGTLLFM